MNSFSGPKTHGWSRLCLSISLLLVCAIAPGQDRPNITRVEYFFDNGDQGIGLNTALPLQSNFDALLPGEDILPLDFSIPTGGLSNGFHKLTFRIKSQQINEDGTTQDLWGHNESSLFYISTTGGSVSPTQIVSGEYFFDNDDLGIENGNPALTISAADGPDGQTVLSFERGFSVANLATGFHQITFRFKNLNGEWSHNESSFFFITQNATTSVAASSITEGEYFFDSDDRGVGSPENPKVSTSFVDGQSTMLAFQGDFSVAGLAPGFHKITFRFKNELGGWSHNESSLFYVTSGTIAEQAAEITTAEYFFDNEDLGTGQNRPLSITSVDGNEGNTLLSFSRNLSVQGLTPGFHRITFRFRNAAGSWSHNETSLLFVTTTTTNNVARNITDGEFFFDGSDNGPGNNTPISTSISGDQLILNLINPESVAGLSSGEHTITYRFQNADGTWSHNESSAFTVSNSPYPIRPGAGHAGLFDGLDDVIVVPTIATTSKSFTIEGWVKWDGVRKTVLSFLDDAGGFDLAILEGGNLRVEMYEGAAKTSLLNSAFVTADRWSHVAVVFSEQPEGDVTAQIFLNGMEGVNSSRGAMSFPTIRSLTIGADRFGLENYGGSLDEIRIWNRSLTHTEIRDRLVRKVKLDNPIQPNDVDGLIHYFNFDEDLTSNEVGDLITQNLIDTGGAAHVPSGAPIGDRSIFSYENPSLLFDKEGGDKVRVDLAEGSDAGLHIYEVTAAPIPFEAPAAYDLINFERYYGYFIANPTSPAVEVSYEFTNSAFAGNIDASDLRLATRLNNAIPQWSGSEAALDVFNSTLDASIVGNAQELILAAVEPAQLLPGETLDNPIQISGFPFSDSRNFDNYVAEGASTPGQVYYAFTAPECDNLKIVLEVSGFFGIGVLNSDGNTIQGSSGGSSGSQTLTATVLTPGEDYFLSLRGGGSYTVTVREEPTFADLLEETEICLAPNGTYVLRANGPPVEANYSWTLNGTTTATGTYSLTVSESGLYEVSYTEGACILLDEVVIYSDTEAGVLSGPSIVRPGEPITLDYLRTQEGSIEVQSFDGTNWIATNPSTVNTNETGYMISLPELVEGEETTIRISHRFGGCGVAVSNEVRLRSVAFRGDNLDNPLVVSEFPASISGTNAATDQGTYTDQFTAAAGGQNAPDVFYRFIAPICANTVTVSTCGSQNFNSVIHLLDDDGSLVSTADNTCGDDGSITFEAIPLSTYYVVVEGFGAAAGMYNLSIEVEELAIDLDTQLELCEGQILVIGKEIEGATYLWSTGATTSTIEITDPGSYSVDITTTAGCTKTAAIEIIPRTEVTPGTPTNLLPESNAEDIELPLTFFWSDDANTATFDLYLWPESQPAPSQPFAADLEVNQFILSDSVALGTRYNWRVEGKNVCGTLSTQGPTWTFRTSDRPDLLIPAVSFEPTFVFPGETIDLSWSYFNEGLEDAIDVDIATEIYLSADLSADSEDLLLTSILFEDTLVTAQDFLVIDTTLSIPPSVAAGAYYLLFPFTTDIDELNTANNFGTSTELLTVQALPSPDLEWSELAYTRTALSGASISINYVLENIGTADVNNILNDRVYLSTSPILDLNSAIILTTFEHIELITVSSTGTVLTEPIEGFQLATDASKELNYFVTLPVSLAPGDYYLHIQGDILNQITEANETNNSLAGEAISIANPALPDLTVESIATDLQSVAGATQLPVSWTVRNAASGTPTVNSWVDAIYLSSTGNCSDLRECGILVGRFGHSEDPASPLVANSTYTQEQEIFVPNDLNGDFFLYVITNDNEAFPEDRSNNVAVSTSAISISPSPGGLGPCGDNFAEACEIEIPRGNYGYGVFPLNNLDLTDATLEPGESETFSPGYADQRSLWYTFTIPTSRYVSINIEESDNQIHLDGQSDISVSVFEPPTFGNLPVLSGPGGTSDLAAFTQLNTFGRTFNECLREGTYYVRISAGQAYLEGEPLNAFLEVRNPASFVDTSVSSSVAVAMRYDLPAEAYTFPFPMGNRWRDVIFESGCLSIDDATEVMPRLGEDANLPDVSANDYDQSAWFVFETDDNIDALRLQLNAQRDFNGINKVGYRLYAGDARNVPIQELTQLDEDILTRTTISTRPTRVLLTPKNMACELEPNSFYSVQLFFHRFHQDRFVLSIHDLGEGATIGADPKAPYTLGVMEKNNTPPTYDSFGRLITPGGKLTTINNNFACNAYIDDAVNACAQVAPDAGFDRLDDDVFDLRQWYTMEFDEAVNLWINNNGSGSKRLNVYPGDIGVACGSDATWPAPIVSLDGNGTASAGFRSGAFRATCLASGVYTIEVLGKAFEEDVLNGASNLGRSNQLEIYVLETQQNHQYDLANFTRVERINNLQPLTDTYELPDVSEYFATNDTLGCGTTILPALPDPLCRNLADIRGGIYRLLHVDRPGVLVIKNAGSFKHRLFQVDMAQLAAEVDANSSSFNVLQDMTNNDCFTSSSSRGINFCLTEGYYLFGAFGNDDQVGAISRPSFTFYAQPADAPKFTQPGISTGIRAPENLGDLTDRLLANEEVISEGSLITCESNPVEIDGEMPCFDYDKLFYREFFLASPQFLEIRGNNFSNSGYPSIRLYTGRASEGVETLRKHDPILSKEGNGCRRGGFGRLPRWRSNLDLCDPRALPSGWYTVVFYANGGDYSGLATDKGFTETDGLFENQITIQRISPETELPSTFNRPHLASRQGEISWERDPETSGAFPVFETRYDFERATLNECKDDREEVAPYHELPVIGSTSYDWVTYYTFELRYPSYARFSGYEKGEIFPFDVSTSDSLLIEGTASQDAVPPLSPCGANQEYCNMLPGTYTLAIYSRLGTNSVRPTLTVDRLLDSRFDFARNAYDMGEIAGTGRPQFQNLDDLFQRHPVYPGRSWTNDFFTCYTGAFQEDPRYPTNDLPPTLDYCHALDVVDLEQYPPSENKPHKRERKTLWYTFVVDGPGMVSVSVFNMTKDKGGLEPYQPDLAEIIENFNPFRAQEALNALLGPTSEQYPFSVYTDEDLPGDLSFEELMANNLFDSTAANLHKGWIGNNAVLETFPRVRCRTSKQTISWDIDVCQPRRKRRYFVVVDNFNAMAPSSQLELAVTFRPTEATPSENDFIPFAFNVNGTENPATTVVLPEGTFTGATSSFNCATADDFDRAGCGSRTIWYRFETDVAGKVRLNFDIDTLSTRASVSEISIYKLNAPIDGLVSRYNGLSPMELTALEGDFPVIDLSQVTIDGAPWVEGCLSPGVYYFTLGCNSTSLAVKPRIQLVPEAGDICANPALAVVEQRNVPVAIPLDIACHSWGGDFGEDGFTNTECFFADESINGLSLDRRDPLQVKSSWFKFSVGAIGKSNLTFDFQSYVGDTFVGINDMKFRVLSGSCGSMSSLGCSPSQTSGFKLDCMPDQTDYYIQVIAPIEADGTLTMSVLAEPPTDPTCTPPELNRIIADFDAEDACQGAELCFNNLSTQGEDIEYAWAFGDGSPLSADLAPCHVFPVTGEPATYDVTLTVTNPILEKSQSLTQIIEVFPPALPTLTINGLLPGEPKSVNSGSPLDFSATPPSGVDSIGYLYTWDFGNDSIYVNPEDPAQVLNFQREALGVRYAPQDAGQRIITLTMSGGDCPATVRDTITVITKLGLDLQATIKNNSCFGASDGAIDLTVSGGTLPYSFNWGLSMEEDVEGLTAGSYQVSVTDALGQQLSAVYTVEDGPLLGLSASIDSLNCSDGNDGAIDLTISGGKAPYTFLWSNGLETEDIAGLDTGRYEVLVVDANGCSSDTTFNVAPKSPPIAFVPTVVDAPCTGECTGSISVTNIAGGIAPYEVSWEDGLITNTRMDLCPGIDYTITVTDANGCSRSQKVILGLADQPVPNLPEITNICEGETAVLDAGNPGASFLWSTGESTQQITVSASGTYSVQIATNLPEVEEITCGMSVRVVDFNQGLRRDGSPVPSYRSDPDKALGTPDQADRGDDHVALGFGGSITLFFDPPIANAPGVDFKLFETTTNDPTPENQPEQAEVYVSEDGTNFELVGIATVDHYLDANEFDLNSTNISRAHYVRIVDTTPNSNKLNTTEAGFDVDGILTLNCEEEAPSLCRFGPEGTHPNIFRQDDFYFLGDYDNEGAPNYFEMRGGGTTTSFIRDEVRSKLPERDDLHLSHPSYIADNLEGNIAVTERSEVFLGFAWEGAKYKNTLGFYTYDLDNPPVNVEDIEHQYIVFPNASLDGSGGNLISGDKVKLGVFPPNTGIGWFLIQDAWRSEGNMDLSEVKIYSNPDWNSEFSASDRRHIAVVPSDLGNITYIGFEDLIRDEESDDDFNDLVIYTEVMPFDGECMADYADCMLISSTDVRVHPVPTITLPSTVMMAPGETLTLTAHNGEQDEDVTYLWSPGNETTPFINVLEPGIYSVVTQNEFGCGSDTQTINVVASCHPDGPHFTSGVISLSSNWQTLQLPRHYTNPVVTATPAYTESEIPAVVRVRNVTNRSFELRLQNPKEAAVAPRPVHYAVVEAGTYTLAQHCIQMEAGTILSTETDRRDRWRGQQLAVNNPYDHPAVIGQVMTINDPDWSVFWARGANQASAPGGSKIYVGKHVGEDNDRSRLDETIGYMIIESDDYSWDNLAVTANRGARIIEGMENDPPYAYALSWNIADLSLQSGVASQAGMSGGNGGWPVLYGANALSADNIQLVIDEDQIGDHERWHMEEMISYLVFGSNASGQPIDQREVDENSSMVVIFPNASNTGLFNIRLIAPEQLDSPDFEEAMYVEVFGPNGAKLTRLRYGSYGDYTIDLTTQSSGYYFVRTTQGKTRQFHTILINGK